MKQRPSRYLAVVALALIGLYLGVFLGPSSTPALGLDLRGGVQITLQAQPLQGGSVSKADLDQAVNIIRNRVNGLGVGGAEISTQGSDNIVVSIPGATNRRQVEQTVGQTALLRFRQVMAVGNAVPTTTPSTSTTVTPSASPSKAGTHGHKTTKQKSSGKKGTSSQGAPLSKALLAKPTPTATSSTSPSPTVSPSPTTSGSASPQPVPTGITTKPAPNSEAPSLTTAFQQAFAKWDCSKDSNPTNGNDVPTDYIIACDRDFRTTAPYKYILAPAALSGQQVKTASADLDPQGTGQWVVDVTFTGSGSSAWLNLTRKTYEVSNSSDSGFGSCAPPKGCNAIGITLDGVVESAPATQQDGIPGGKTQISGNFSQSTASDLANVLKYGALPLKFTVATSQSVSATLGSSQLHGGLVAGAIGLGLVIVFSLLYYRALGLVTIGSLLVSGLILYAVTTLLGHSSLGYTLSLPGIAGFIVAVGITADSFVVFFERLRDEVREGRRLRSAVDRGWPRARRTILSADTVSLLAAVILYIVSIGDVRGFAFTLGLSTLSDLFIVFFFTKPLVTVLSRWRAFDSGKAWTGVGRARMSRKSPDRDRQPTTQAQEA